MCVYIDVEDVQITLDKNRSIKYKHVCPLCHSGRNTLRLEEILRDTETLNLQVILNIHISEVDFVSMFSAVVFFKCY